MNNGFQLFGNIVEIVAERIFFGRVDVMNGMIAGIEELNAEDASQPYILPGFTDSHVHIESSMLVPTEFARLAVVHGTVATVSDPHEIANVCGKAGVEYMLDNARTSPFHFYFGAPSCVPATQFETAGAALPPQDVDELMKRDDIFYLSEMMNFPGVIHDDPDIAAKILSAKKAGKPVDGHAPALTGTDLKKYVSAGISTDHECFTKEEAEEKLALGMKILIREGSAAKNFEALIPLLRSHSSDMMFCSDDLHPDSLVKGHIDRLCARAMAAGVPLFNVLRAACLNPVLHYGLTHGLLRKSDPATFIIANDLTDFRITATYLGGEKVAENGRSLLSATNTPLINNFDRAPIKLHDVKYERSGRTRVIEALDGQLITNEVSYEIPDNGNFESDVSNDVLKIAVVNRYRNEKPAIAFIKNFGLKKGAIASSVAHDSHNIVAVGVSDEEIVNAVNAVIDARGGISATSGSIIKLLELPVAGLMTNADGYETAAAYSDIDAFAKNELGSSLSAPFMTLSFMALLVIPHLKLSDRGLFDGDNFGFTD